MHIHDGFVEFLGMELKETDVTENLTVAGNIIISFLLPHIKLNLVPRISFEQTITIQIGKMAKV